MNPSLSSSETAAPQSVPLFSLILGRSLGRTWLDSHKPEAALWAEDQPGVDLKPDTAATGEAAANTGVARAQTLDVILAGLAAAEPVANLLTPEEIAADFARDIDPWAESLNGARPAPLAEEAMTSLIALLSFARGFGAPEDLAGLFAPAALTLVFAADADSAEVLGNALCPEVLAQLTQAAGIAEAPVPKVVAANRNGTGSDAARPGILRGWITKHLRAGASVLAIVTTPAAPGRVLTALAERTLHLPRLDAGLMLEALRLTHSATGQMAEDEVLRRLPATEALRRLDATAVDVAAHAQTTLSVARRLAVVSERLGPAERVTLADLHGQPALRAELERMCRDLDLWRAGRLDWSQCVASAVFHGPPGNGKTLCAQALAGSAGVPLVTTSYAECQRHGHQGDMLAALSRAFDDAIRSAPSVLLIDEIDSFAARGTGGQTGRYLHNVVNGFLEQLNRAAGAVGVIVLAATNHLSSVDPAVIRSGRFDLKLHVGAPDRVGLAAILQGHLELLAPGHGLVAAEIDALAGRLVGASGADVAALVRAGATAARDTGRALTLEDLTRAAADIAPLTDTEDERRVSFHEAGHILVGILSGMPAPRSARLTRHGGEVVYPAMPVLTRPEALGCLRRDLAGRAAEAVMLGSVSSGAGVSAESDLAKATQLAFAMEVQYGFGDGGLIWQPGPGVVPPPPWLAAKINQLLNTAEAEASTLIRRHRPQMIRIAEALLTRRELTAADIRDLTRDLAPEASEPSAGQPGNVIPFPGVAGYR